LGDQARATLRRLKYTNVHVRVGDGFKGWPEAAPFDRIMVTCSAAEVPAPLLAQLKEGGRLIMPLGEDYQQSLWQYTKVDGRLRRERLIPTVFVPMTGEAKTIREAGTPFPRVQLINGGFEGLDPASGKLASWYHQRQLRLQQDPSAPEGVRFVTFQNATKGRQAHASQAFAIDGRETPTIEVCGTVRGTDIQPGAGKDQIAAVVITFYDQQRDVLRQEAIGNWRGSFGWQRFLHTIAVPAATREAIVHLGLLGAVGTLSFDALTIQPGPPPAK
jgi:protein-L-isoaspartate(D-aspartate) O-methyltransferase